MLSSKGGPVFMVLGTFGKKFGKVVVPIPSFALVVVAIHILLMLIPAIFSVIAAILSFAYNHIFWSLGILWSIFNVLPNLGRAKERVESVVKADDVTRMNATVVDRIFMVR